MLFRSKCLHHDIFTVMADVISIGISDVVGGMQSTLPPWWMKVKMIVKSNRFQ